LQVTVDGGESVKFDRNKTKHRVDAEEQSVGGKHGKSASYSPGDRTRPALKGAEPASDASVPRGGAKSQSAERAEELAAEGKDLDERQRYYYSDSQKLAKAVVHKSIPFELLSQGITPLRSSLGRESLGVRSYRFGTTARTRACSCEIAHSTASIPGPKADRISRDTTGTVPLRSWRSPLAYGRDQSCAYS